MPRPSAMPSSTEVDWRECMAAQVAGALQALYDEEIVDEALILAWFEKATAGKILGVPAKAASDVRRAASPFIEWLREADEGGDEEEEDDDEDEDDED